MTCKIWRPLLAACLLCMLACREQPAGKLNRVVVLPNYPSGSAIEMLHHKVWLMGDDAPWLLQLDSTLTITDSLQLFFNTAPRLSKETKPDLEAMTVLTMRGKEQLLLVGSGSADSLRNKAIVVHKDSSRSIDLTVFYNRLKKEGIRDLNIEGISAYQGGMILASRGNKGFRKNLLIFTSRDFFARQDSAGISITSVGVQTDTAFFNGISGAGYAAGSDRLILTVSTENTYDSYADGSIGKSYLWIINDVSRKKFSHINPDRIVELDALDARFAGHKIESVCVVREDKKQMELLLAADDDKGETILFSMTLQK